MLSAFCDEGVPFSYILKDLALLFEDIYAFIKHMTYKPDLKTYLLMRW